MTTLSAIFFCSSLYDLSLYKPNLSSLRILPHLNASGKFFFVLFCFVLTQRAHDVKMTSYQRRCDVMTSHRRRYDVIMTSCACWGNACHYLNLQSTEFHQWQTINTALVLGVVSSLISVYSISSIMVCFVVL